jgi:hypothetical protein
MPPAEWGAELLDYFWEIGPVKKDGPIEAPDLVAWERILGIEWQPYESRLLIKLSKAYMAESHAASSPTAKCPWPEFESRWRWAQNQIGEKSLDKEQKRAARRAAKLEK